jgi:uncharacterized C2H2 Zn-finger protein
MSQKECPACKYTFLKKRDFIDHVTYSSCAEKLQDMLVLCPHCNKQFTNDDSLSYHMMRNEECSNKQDMAVDMLNRLPRKGATMAKRMKLTNVNTEEKSVSSYCIQQGVIVNNKVTLDNQRVYHGGTKSSNTKFIPLSLIQGGGDKT